MTAPARFYKHRSALEAYQCPMFFKAKYMDGLVDQSAAARRGTAFHIVMHRYVQLLVEHGCSDDLDLAKIAFREGIAASMVPESVVAEVAEIFWPFAEVYTLNVDAVLMTEEMPDDEYRWRPDLVLADKNALEVVDWKTHWA